MLGRTLILLAVVVAAAVAVYAHGTGLDSGGPPGSPPVIRLWAQEGSAEQGWTTTRRLSVACGRRSAMSGSNPASARSLCESLAYYASHRHARLGPQCAPVIVAPKRVVIAGRLGGRPQRLVIGTVCNPTPALLQALQRIDHAAFA